MGKRIQIDENTKSFLCSCENMPTEIKISNKSYFPKEYRAAGFKGVVWKGLDEYNGDVAIKFTIYEDYQERSYREEAKMARKLRGRAPFAIFIDADIVEISSPTNNIKTVCFVEEWIDGWTLSEYLNQYKVNKVNISFLLNYVKGMCEALNILKVEGLRHDDLRPANVMIAKPKEGDIPPFETKVKVIDTGSLKSADIPCHKEKDDHTWFTEHIIDIYNTVRKNNSLSLEEKCFLRKIKALLNSMLEEDRAIALCEPTKVLSQFENSKTESYYPPKEEEMKLSDPFDYITAEHIVSDKLLVGLFAESCPWLKEVSSPNPVLLTGPRGCGKSMVFRRISLKALLYKNVEDIIKSEIAGFYISCSADLRNRLGWIRTEDVANRFLREIIHYFNLLLTREIIQTLFTIVCRDDREKLFGFGKGEETKVHTFLMEKLGITEIERLRLQGVTLMEHASEIIESEMNECYEYMCKGTEIFRATDTTFISDFTHYLSKNINYFKERKIVFLIDDFSVHRIPIPVQSILNPIIWDRQASHVFKLSSEKYGAKGIDILKATAEATRELREVDCGQFYINLLGNKESKQFAEELLARRLKLSNYVGTPKDILGRSIYKEGSLGKTLRARSNKKGRIDDQYYGIETIANFCSGDISALLEIYRRIFEKGRITSSTREMVSANIQHAAIESVSREFLNLIRNYVPAGEDMYNIVTHFGNLSCRILREGRLQKKGKGWIPCETSRIEVDDPPGKCGETMTDTQEELIEELVRRAIFIEMEPGRTRHKHMITLRWQLRRIYCPAFGTTGAKNTAIKWKSDEFKEFLINPEKACEDEFSKRWKDGKRAVGSPILPFDELNNNDSYNK